MSTTYEICEPGPVYATGKFPWARKHKTPEAAGRALARVQIATRKRHGETAWLDAQILAREDGEYRPLNEWEQDASERF